MRRSLLTRHRNPPGESEVTDIYTFEAAENNSQQWNQIYISGVFYALSQKEKREYR